MIRAGLRLPPSKALPFVELGARLNKELGAGVGSGELPLPVIINFNSNVDPIKLRRGAEPEDGP